MEILLKFHETPDIAPRAVEFAGSAYCSLSPSGSFPAKSLARWANGRERCPIADAPFVHVELVGCASPEWSRQKHRGRRRLSSNGDCGSLCLCLYNRRSKHIYTLRIE